MKQRTILFLGAADFQTPPIQYALNAGYRVITCDNRPENTGHALAHKTYNVSTLDIEAIHQIAEAESIDGILSFGSDVSAYTAAFVAREIDLPGNSPESISSLCKKHLFRQRLSAAGVHQLNVRHFHAAEFDEAVAFGRSFYPGDVVIKPADSSGSKGVSICSSPEQVPAAVKAALATSISMVVVIEERVPRLDYQVCGDGYFQDGGIAFVQYGNGHFYDRPDRLAPYGESFPSAHSATVLDTVTATLEEALRACSFSQGPFNLDVLIDARDQRPFIVEIGPRSGGNYIPTVIRYHTGVDMIEAAVEGCLSSRYRLRPSPTPSGNHCCFMLHASVSGIYKGFELPAGRGARILEQHPYLTIGERYQSFVSANHAIGNIILEFDDYEMMLRTLDHPESVVRLL